MKEFLERYKNKGIINRSVLRELSEIMKKEKFCELFGTYKKKNKETDILNSLKDQMVYKNYIEESNIIEIKVIIFYVTNEILKNKEVDVNEYNDFFIYAFNQLIIKNKECHYYCAFKSIDWVKSVIYQGNRIITLDNEQYICNKFIFNNMESSPELATSVMDKFDNDRYILSMEEHFFIIALEKSIKFLEKLAGFQYEVKDIINRIDEIVGRDNIRDLRNMREHDDEYIEGRGRNQANFFQESKDGNNIGDATSTCIRGEKEHWLGEKVEVIEVVRLYKALLPRITDITDKIMTNISL